MFFIEMNMKITKIMTDMKISFNWHLAYRTPIKNLRCNH